MKIKFFLVSVCFITLFGLAGCTNFSLKNKGQDFVRVVDLNNHVTHVKYGKSSVKRVFSSSTDYNNLQKKDAPTWAKKSFKYVIHYSKHNMTVTILVYSNYKYATVRGIPIIGDGLLKLNNTQFNDLNDPGSLFEK